MTIGLLHRLVSALAVRHRRFGTIVEGMPLVLLQKGQWQTENMRKMRIQDMDVMAAARTKGLKNLRQIRYAVLERLGSITIIKEDK
jgi:uncharacterized membrane protein YcaP (DUF421 family)